MIPIKVPCGCGQEYEFEAEPIDGQLASPVACPVCGADGTRFANYVISQSSTTPAAQAASARSPLRMAHSEPAAPVEAFERVADITPPASTLVAERPKRVVQKPTVEEPWEFNLGRGILGAFIGAAVGCGAMYGFFALAGFRFPLLGIGIGYLTGYVAKTMARATDSTLGIIAGAIALVAVVGTLYLMYGEFPIISIISVVVSVSVAHRVASS
ncbi:MAG: hypothetical protein ACXWIU_15250 [Limisphaerales bacterium]